MKALILLAATVLALPAQETPAPAPAAPAAEPGLYATIQTTMGAITIRLFEKETPITVRNFQALARGTKAWPDPKTRQMVRRPFYNGLTFHRAMANFMIQTGDPTGTGAYNPGFTIKDEFVPSLKFDVPGRVAMANVEKPNTGNCQFFITEVPTPHLDGKHTVFGQVVEGQEVVKKIAHVPVGAGSKPLTPVRIEKITFRREGPAQ
jgi:cyclophilin family peptidyl-prolyl cis-trans isomerase